MTKNTAVRLTIVLAALASSAVAADFAGQTQTVDGLARKARSLEALQTSCPIDSGSTQASFIKVADEAAADFTLNDLSGKSVTLSSLRGKVVLLDFWATWCPPCRASTPFLQELQNQYGSKGLVILGVNQGEEVDAVKEYMNEKGLTYQVVLDPSSSMSKASYQIRGIPAFVLVGTDGKIIWRKVGYSSDMQSEFKTAIEKALASSGKATSI